MFGKAKILESLRNEADKIREWLLAHTSPDIPVSEFEVYANRYAIICTRISIIEKQW